MLLEHAAEAVAVAGAIWGAARQAWQFATSVHELAGAVHILGLRYEALRSDVDALRGTGR
jgi:hypothetical protein